MLTSEILSGADNGDVKVGIGCCPDSKHVPSSVRAAGNPNVRMYGDARSLAGALTDGDIDVAIRGDLSSSKLLPLIREALGLRKLERAVIVDVGGKAVVMAPVGIDEGWAVESRVDMAERSAKLLRHLGAGTQRIAVMSGGRCEDRGRCPQVDRSIDDALGIVEILKGRGYDAYHAQILIEDAIDQADIVITPDGVAGNIIFRTMHFVGNAPTMGAPVLNGDRPFIDTSRRKTDYTDTIALAVKIAGMER